MSAGSAGFRRHRTRRRHGHARREQSKRPRLCQDKTGIPTLLKMPADDLQTLKGSIKHTSLCLRSRVSGDSIHWVASMVKFSI